MTSCKSIFVLVLSFFLLAVNARSQTTDVTTMHQRVYNKIVSTTINYTVAQTYTTNMQASGTWTDIDYTNTSNSTWIPIQHLDRLLLIAQSYSKSASSQYNSNSVRDKIVLGLQYWKTQTPTSINWYFNDISGPSQYSKILVLLKGKIDNTLLFDLSTYLKDQTDRFTNGGENLVWIAEITLNKGVIENSDALITKAIKATASTLAIADVDGVVGIKIDNSYHLHATLLYSGGYGLSFVTSTLTNIELVAGTKYYSEYTSDKLAILGNYVLYGLQRFSFKRIIDFSTVGRYIARTNLTSGISTGTLDRLIKADPARASQYTNYKNFINGSKFENPGSTFFFKSDILTKNGPDYYMSARMISTRTVGTETTNGENLKGFYLPIGATNFYTSGNEYYNIFPSWNWARIPGITAEDSEVIYSASDKKATKGTNEFSGGVSNGKDGICAFDGNFNGIKARKSYFIFGDAMICLGMGITASKLNPIITSVNQCFANGTVTLFDGTKSTNITKSSATNTYDNLRWIHHDKIGYIFTEGSKTNVTNSDQTGSWFDINTSHSKTPVVSNVFSVWIDHTKKPTNSSYQYIVAPNLTLDEFKNYYNTHGFVVVENTGDIQAVKNVKAGLFGVVFYKAGIVDFGDDFKVTADREAIVLISGTAENFKISVGDPLFKATTIKITMNKNVNGINVTPDGDFSSINFSMPTGDFAGSTATDNYKIIGLTASSKEKLNSTNIIKAYPNPSIDEFNVELLQDVRSINVTDIQGRSLFKSGKEFPVKRKYLFGKKFPVGLYILNVEFSNGTSQSIKLEKINSKY